jgi:hypoxanthine phosphoribosyltransferase
MSQPQRIRVLYDEVAIAERNAEMAAEIAATAGDNLLVVAVLKGSFMFVADLIRAMHRTGMTPQVEFVHLSSYRAATISSGQVEILRDVQSDVRGRRCAARRRHPRIRPHPRLRQGPARARVAPHASPPPCCSKSRASAPSISRPTMSASNAPIISSSATAWTSLTPIANCPIVGVIETADQAGLPGI